MRRMLSLLLIGTALTSTLAACGSSGGTGSAGGTAGAATSAPAAATSAPATASDPAAAATSAPSAPAATTAAAPAATAGTGAATGGGETLIIASSLPRTGSSKAQTDTVVNAIKQRLAKDSYTACNGKFKIEYQDLDDATAAAGKWTPEVEASNANKVAASPNTVAYIGTFNSGASKISIPILNQVNVVMVSPSATYPGLTKPGKGEPNEPNVYYPNGPRNFARVLPSDDVQGAAVANFAKELGVKSVYILDDTELYGKGVADVFDATAKSIGIDVKGHEGVDGKAQDYRAVAAKILDLNPDMVYYGGITPNNAGQLIRDIRGEGFKGILMAPDGVYEEAFLKAAGDAAEGMYVTFGGTPGAQLTGAAREWYTDYKAKYNNAEPEIYAVYAYEATSVVMAAINKVCVNDRAAIRDAVMGTKDFEGVLGKWSFDANGDTSLTNVSVSQVKGGKFEFIKPIK